MYKSLERSSYKRTLIDITEFSSLPIPKPLSESAEHDTEATPNLPDTATTTKSKRKHKANTQATYQKNE
jgi:hypothetical protein